MRVFITGGSGYVGRNMIRYLKSKSIPVVALARSDEAEKVVTQAGAESSVRGDLDNKQAILEGMKGCDTVIHAAAYVNSQGPWKDFYNVTVLGTKRVLESAVETDSIKRFVHIGSEAALCTLQPLVNIDETYPLPDKPVGNYAKSKNLSERLVREANNTPKKDSGVLETVVVRPRFIWGGDDTVVVSTVFNTHTTRWPTLNKRSFQVTSNG
jgi:nucleoside-diphosphate-sugar epimerase